MSTKFEPKKNLTKNQRKFTTIIKIETHGKNQKQQILYNWLIAMFSLFIFYEFLKQDGSFLVQNIHYKFNHFCKQIQQFVYLAIIA